VAQSVSIISGDAGSVVSANEGDSYFAIQQRQFAAKMTDRISLRVFRRITEVFHYCISQIECSYEFRPGTFADFHGIADVIGMAVRDQDKINVFERSQFILRFFENRIRDDLKR